MIGNSAGTSDKCTAFSKARELPNNLYKTLPETLKPSALQVFKDKYSLNFISIEDSDDERDIENKG